ncbi:hypothetical protein BC628DRAFT_1166611 [Trametes gibbosa]|nr:hypothetical protein BC628DRAFT_1166611 [Trametes gibbosa]
MLCADHKQTLWALERVSPEKARQYRCSCIMGPGDDINAPLQLPVHGSRAHAGLGRGPWAVKHWPRRRPCTCAVVVTPPVACELVQAQERDERVVRGVGPWGGTRDAKRSRQRVRAGVVRGGGGLVCWWRWACAPRRRDGRTTFAGKTARRRRYARRARSGATMRSPWWRGSTRYVPARCGRIHAERWGARVERDCAAGASRSRTSPGNSSVCAAF